MSQKREDLRVGYVALSVRREKAAAVIVSQAHRASTCRVDGISAIGNGMQRESGSLRGRSELGAQVVGLQCALNEYVNAGDFSCLNLGRGNFSSSLGETHSLKITGAARRRDLSEIRDDCIRELGRR